MYNSGIFEENPVKFRNFVNFSGKNHVKFGHFVNFSYIFFGQNVVLPKVDLSSYAYEIHIMHYRYFDTGVTATGPLLLAEDRPFWRTIATAGCFG